MFVWQFFYEIKCCRIFKNLWLLTSYKICSSKELASREWVSKIINLNLVDIRFRCKIFLSYKMWWLLKVYFTHFKHNFYISRRTWPEEMHFLSETAKSTSPIPQNFLVRSIAYRMYVIKWWPEQRYTMGRLICFFSIL